MGKTKKEQVTINLSELSRMAGTSEFKCKCGKKINGHQAINNLFKIIVNQLTKGNKIKIINFGVFELKKWKTSKSNILAKRKWTKKISFIPAISVKNLLKGKK